MLPVTLFHGCGLNPRRYLRHALVHPNSAR
jgi:hypothetical protein